MITPEPTDDEAAALVSAIDAMWPTIGVVAVPESARTTAWRFSGRWWHRDRFAPVDRPWS
jgi:hypothetical protein